MRCPQEIGVDPADKLQRHRLVAVVGPFRKYCLFIGTTRPRSVIFENRTMSWIGALKCRQWPISVHIFK